MWYRDIVTSVTLLLPCYHTQQSEICSGFLIVFSRSQLSLVFYPWAEEVLALLLEETKAARSPYLAFATAFYPWLLIAQVMPYGIGPLPLNLVSVSFK